MKYTLISICLLISQTTLVGCSSKDEQIVKGQDIIYMEDCPAIYEARLIKPAHNYKKFDWDSYAVYGDLPIVKEYSWKEFKWNPGNPPMTIWRTKKATYFAIVEELGWVRSFFAFSDGIFLRDCDTGEQYPIIEVVNFPFNQDFFIEGVPGDHIYILLKFPPLPKTTRRIDYYEPYVNQEYAFEYNDLSIEALEANHHIIDPAERKIVY